MIKLFPQSARWLALVLDLAESNLGPLDRLLQQRIRTAEQELSLSDTGRVVLELGEEQPIAPTVAELKQELLDQLLRPLSSAEEATLVDRMVNILQSPHGRNVLAGKTLQALRKALLTGEELRGLEERLDRLNSHCAACGKEISYGEVVTFYIDSLAGRPGQGAIFCAHCKRPTRVACSVQGCAKTVEIKDRVLLRDGPKCVDHQEEKKKKEKEVEPAGSQPIVEINQDPAVSRLAATLHPAALPAALGAPNLRDFVTRWTADAIIPTASPFDQEDE
jgi:hypothetical protein